MSNFGRFLVLLCIMSLSCSETTAVVESVHPDTYWGDNPWPEIRKERINKLLPQALNVANVECWLVICRENNNDPIADHIGGENAGGTAVFLFYNDAVVKNGDLLCLSRISVGLLGHKSYCLRYPQRFSCGTPCGSIMTNNDK